MTEIESKKASEPEQPLLADSGLFGRFGQRGTGLELTAFCTLLAVLLLLETLWIKLSDSSLLALVPWLLISSGMVVAVVAYLQRQRESSLPDLGLALPQEKLARKFFYGVWIGFCLGLGISIIANTIIKAGLSQADASSLIPASKLDLLCMGLVIIPVRTVLEELVFRGFLFSRLEALAQSAARPNLGLVTACLGSSLLFGLWHMPEGSAVMVIQGILGLAMAGLYLTGDRSLYIPIIARLTINGLGMAAMMMTVQ